ncbi:BREX-1 system phosphatase PglZ type A [Paenibacillus sp. Soil724D2]|uniref:BREX-1 system phosphatase PglZ type A n=1 Tax=Paenibacillus sp. (strain Soil724D2) TaxID=1736392 RepID=UPI000712E56B|nr:BREX-1 system phosphatase PglZ type A [Paenibacillus sp. Soil724D2]KRE50661.1 alkaline phosphatase [Paenibacillus sp. Soil724D2]
MNMDEVVKALQQAYQQPLQEGEQRKIVFWLDNDQEFINYIDEIALDNVKIQKLTAVNSFYTKYLLEEEDRTSHYLIYVNSVMNTEENWLFDMFLYSKKFYADKLSLIMNELSIDTSLRGVVKKYEKFFGSKDRIRKFKGFEASVLTQETIELMMMSALCNLKTPDFEDVLKIVLMDTLDDSHNKYMDYISKNIGLEVFWNAVTLRYGYEQSQKSLKTLFIHLTVTALSHAVNEGHLSLIKNYIATRSKSNALVFIDHWMHHKTDYHIFDEYAEITEKEIKLSDIVNQLPVEEFKAADTFPYFDKAIIIHIANSLEERLEDYEAYSKLINLRRSKHYYERYQYIYEALFYTVKMFEFYKKYNMGIPKAQAVDMYRSYVNDYYQMDSYYRKFYVAYDIDSNSEILKKLKPLVENLYTNWFMGELSTLWSAAVQDEMKSNWVLPGIQNQKDFYRSFVAPKIHNGDRVFVIISDALRFEIAAELTEKLNSETTGACDLQSLLGVVPSVTKMGMASLLPHKSLDIDLKGQVWVDGKSSSGTDNRIGILQTAVADSTAVSFQELKNMNKAGRRETFKGKKLVYIYHDSIDATGDKASTEVYTFSAVERAIDEMYDIVKIIKDDLSGTNIFITADHGFVYQREPLVESDKIEKEGIHAFEVKRRHLLSRVKGERNGLLDINMNNLIKNEHQITTYVPKATIRFKIQGAGANFVHGGASLQEIVVPLISFKNVRSGQKNSREIEKVDVKLTSTTTKITNSLFTLNFFQMEKVEDKRVPRTVKIFMVDDKDAVISNEEMLICDRTSDKPDERTFKLRFALKSIPYDKNGKYYLITKDDETNVIVEKTPFTINLGIVSDFDF